MGVWGKKRVARGLCALALAGTLACPAAAWAVEAPAALEAEAFDAASAPVLKDTVTLGVKGAYLQSNAQQMLGYLNEARAAVGVAPLAWNQQLEQVAMQRAAELVALFDHVRPDGTSCFTAADGIPNGAVGENILMGVPDAATANALWTGSPGHYANMIDGRFTSVGAACFQGPDGYWYWVEFFGTAPDTGFTDPPLDIVATVGIEASKEYLPLALSDFEPDAWYADAVVYALNNGIMGGYSDQPLFGCYDNVTRGQVATILWRLAGEPDAGSGGFSDVLADAYYASAVAWAKQAGVVSGYEDSDRFGPDDEVTREQLAAMLCNYAREVAGLSVATSGASLLAMPDASSVSSWARESVAWALDKGIMNGIEEGGASYVRPQSPAWRASMAAMAGTFHRDVLN